MNRGLILFMGVPPAGSGYILGAVTFASLAARLPKPSPWSRPQGGTIPNANAKKNLLLFYTQSHFWEKSNDLKTCLNSSEASSIALFSIASNRLSVSTFNLPESFSHCLMRFIRTERVSFGYFS